MPELRFRIEGAEPHPHAVSPHLVFRLAVEQEETPPAEIRNVLLHVQVRIEPQQRSYDAAARRRLFELFGQPEQWSRSLRSLLWTHVNVTLPAFSKRLSAELHVPCSFDFNIAATRYLDGLDDGDVPVSLFFSGTVFHAGPDGGLRTAPIPWDREASFRLPVRVWKDMMELYYPRSAWLRVGKDAFDRLRDYARRSGLPTCQQALERLLESAAAGSPP